MPNVTAVMGEVVDANGAGLPGVKVKGGGSETTSDPHGKFQLDAQAGSAVVLTFELSGFLRGIERLDVLQGTPSALKVTMIKEAPAVVLDADAGGTAAGARNASIVAPPGAFKDAAGNAVTGSVDVHLTPLDPAVAAELDAYPGDLLATPLDGSQAQLDTYGVLDVTVRQNGAELDIKDGMTVDISIPAPTGITSPPGTVELWSFDEAKAVWVEEGSATFNAATSTYEAKILASVAVECGQGAIDYLRAWCGQGQQRQRHSGRLHHSRRHRLLRVVFRSGKGQW